jgi:hypothetical protein
LLRSHVAAALKRRSVYALSSGRAEQNRARAGKEWRARWHERVLIVNLWPSTLRKRRRFRFARNADALHYKVNLD